MHVYQGYSQYLFMIPVVATVDLDAKDAYLVEEGHASPSLHFSFSFAPLPGFPRARRGRALGKGTSKYIKYTYSTFARRGTRTPRSGASRTPST